MASARNAASSDYYQAEANQERESAGIAQGSSVPS
jgi:hypothetical protein